MYRQTSIMIKNIVVFEGDTPITQSTEVVLAATKMCIIYCGHFSKTSLIQRFVQSKEDICKCDVCHPLVYDLISVPKELDRYF